MIRRSTLVFLTCLTAIGAPAMRPKIAAASIAPGSGSSQTLMAQASGGSAAGSVSSALDVGARGEAVKVVQRRLQQSQYYKGPVDGIYGLATQRAVSTFQSDANLATSGRLDDETWQELQAVLSTQNDANTEPAANQKPATDAEPAIFAANAADATPLLEARPTASELPAIEQDGVAINVTTADAATVDDAETVDDTAAGDDAETIDSAEAVDDTVVVDDTADGISPAMGWGLGLAGLLAGLGVGFLVANRGKSKVGPAVGDPWGEADLNAGAPNRALSVRMETPVTGQPGPRLSGSSLALQTGAIAPTTSALQTSSQMGEVSSLTQGDVVGGLIGNLRNPDPVSRRKSIWELGQRGNSMAVQPLVDAMVDADSKEKSLLLAALSEIGARSLKPMNRALAIALKDDNPEVRKNAIRDLTRIYELVVQISQMLGHATEDEYAEVRQTATWALEQLNRIRRVSDTDPNMRAFTGGSGAKPIDLLSSEASIRRTQ
ncbi:hypothetical protein BH23CYA1_BH23CYA1_17540 [soil metagenome]